MPSTIQCRATETKSWKLDKYHFTFFVMLVCWCFLSFACFAFTTKTKRFASVEEFYFFPLTGSDDEYLPIHRQDNNMIINKKVACIKEDSGVKFLLLGLSKQKNSE